MFIYILIPTDSLEGYVLHTMHMHDLKFTLIVSNSYLEAICLQFQSIQQNHKLMK